MPIKKSKLITTRDHVTKRLDEVLADWLPRALDCPVSKAKVRKLIMAGAVYLNGKRVRSAAQFLVAGTAIETYIDVEKLFEDSTTRDQKFELTMDRILFEDDDLILVDKPPGLPAQPTVDEARDNLFSAVHRFLSRRDSDLKPYLGVHHRLDRDTSGVVLFTKTQRVNAAVSESFSRHKVVKIYHTLTKPSLNAGSRTTLRKEWTIKNYLGTISSKSKRARYGAVHADGQLAETHFRVLEELRRAVWIEAIPKTGRTHQIRVHLAEYGLPILGDDLYGTGTDDNSIGRDGLAPRLMLHAAQLIFPHPITGQETRVPSPLPKDFRECLNRIRN